MILDRRQFLLLTVGLAAGCDSVGRSKHAPQTVNAGPATNYAADGAYAHFRATGFFVIRNGNSLVALSSICTHRSCVVTLRGGHGFRCPCHGSEFDSTGHVLTGPAKRDLPVLDSHVDEHGFLMVNVPGW